MEGDILNEQSVDESEAQKCYNYAQVFLIKYMLHKGIVTSAEEYAEKYAEVFEMLATGALQTRASMDWNRVREKAQEVIGNTKDKIKSFKIFDD